MSREYNLLNPKQTARDYGNRWYIHYRTHLTNIAFQLFKWEGLPESVSPKYLEMSLHSMGYVGFYKHKTLGYIVSKGAYDNINFYDEPINFTVANPIFSDTFKIYNYGSEINDSGGVLIGNNDLRHNTLDTIDMFARELANTHEISRINLNAQKTPVLIKGNQDTILSIKNMYNQYEGNAPAIVIDEQMRTDDFGVFKTDAPYLVDKLNAHRTELWYQALTFLGINNSNTDKKERMITDEAQSNNDMILNSGSIMLKSRQEACELINNLYGLNISVDYRVKESESIEKVADEVGNVHNTPKNHN